VHRGIRAVVELARVSEFGGRCKTGIGVRSLGWLATDNSTAVAAYHKGTTSSEKLQDMVTELRNLTITGNFVLNVFHIAGTRMIQIGIDGLSRGEMQLGALASTPTSAAPLHLSALERSPALLGWLHEWLGFNSNIAKPEDWFYAAQQAGSEDGHREYWVFMVPLEIALSKMHKESPASSRALLRQFWSATKQVPIVRQSVLRIVLQDNSGSDFLVYRPQDESGEDLMAPGEERKPPGHFSVGYRSGMKAAIGVLVRSQMAGRHEAKLKYSSARKARTVHTDVWQASARAVEKMLVWRSERS
jgi:hypothetical protein